MHEHGGNQLIRWSTLCRLPQPQLGLVARPTSPPCRDEAAGRANAAVGARIMTEVDRSAELGRARDVRVAQLRVLAAGIRILV